MQRALGFQVRRAARRRSRRLGVRPSPLLGTVPVPEPYPLARLESQRDDAGIVQSRGSDHADGAQHPLSARHIGRRDHGGTRKRKQPRFRPDEDAHALRRRSTPSSRPISCSFCSRSSNRTRTSSRSSAVSWSCSRLARPRTIRRPFALGPAGPGGQPVLDQAGGGGVQLAPGRVQLGAHLGARLGQGAALQPGVEEVGRLLQGRRRHPGRQRHQPVLDRAVVADQHRQGLIVTQGDELDVFDARVAHRAGHDAGPAGQAGQQGRGLVQRLVEAAALAGQPRVDLASLLGPDVADLQQAIDEQPQAGMGRDPPRRGVGCRQQARPASGPAWYCGSRRATAATPLMRHGARADGLAGLQIGLDDAAEDVAGPLVEAGQGGGGGAEEGHA